MNIVDQLAVAVHSMSDLVDRLWHQQLECQVPGGGTVHQSLDRMMVVAGAATYWLRGQEPPELTAPAVYGWVPAAEFREVMDELLAAASEPGTLARHIPVPGGPVTGDELVRSLVQGLVLHGSEVAMAAGQRLSLSADLAAAIDPFAAVG